MTRNIWAISPGHAGMESQALGLAESIAALAGATVSVRRVPVGLPWRMLPGDFWPFPLRAPARDALAEPWPDLVVSCGRQAAPIAAAMRASSHGRVRAVHVQNPLMRLAAFDLVVAPAHDGIAGPNVITSTVALHRMTPERLAAGRLAWASRLVAPGRRLVSVLLGAPRADAGAEDAARLADQLGVLARDPLLRLAVTPSRRTPAPFAARLAARLAGTDAFLWDGQGDNPYAGMLACADAIIATEDSVSMMSEALAVGRPVLVARFGGTSRRLGAFLQGLVAEGLVRWFDGTVPDWPARPLDENPAIAAQVIDRLGWHSTASVAA